MNWRTHKQQRLTERTIQAIIITTNAALLVYVMLWENPWYIFMMLPLLFVGTAVELMFANQLLHTLRTNKLPKSSIQYSIAAIKDKGTYKKPMFQLAHILDANILTSLDDTSSVPTAKRIRNILSYYIQQPKKHHTVIDTYREPINTVYEILLAYHHMPYNQRMNSDVAQHMTRLFENMHDDILEDILSSL